MLLDYMDKGGGNVKPKKLLRLYKMKSVEKHIIKKSHDWYNYCTDITTTSRCLYNTVQYNQRQGYFYGHKFLNLSQLDKCFKDNENYKKLPAKVAQLVLKQNVDAWSAYYAALDEYKQDSSKFTGKPKIPSFLVKRYNLIKFNNQAVGKKEFNKGFIVPSMSPLRIPVKPGMKFENICEVRIVPKVGCFVIEVVADINGAFNIGRKVIPNYFDCLQEELKRDRGCLVVHPRRITPTFKREHASVSVA
ncbi:hypothetical protein [Aetokthonos hydrillicola]|uniref:hypothetical protein n=1 Tax=Aetokthonos hydrillicola TaxID=1550245 RepID=UPI001FBBC624|nr:hypothetical protein [Aetokthonos hydrillicola]